MKFAVMRPMGLTSCSPVYLGARGVVQFISRSFVGFELRVELSTSAFRSFLLQFALQLENPFVLSHSRVAFSLGSLLVLDPESSQLLVNKTEKTKRDW